MNKRNMTEQRFADSQLYTDVLAACEKALLFEGQINKLNIMRECHNEALVDNIRWDWIIKKISASKDMPGGEVQLIPVAERFFKANAKTKAAMHVDPSDPSYVAGVSFPGKYIAHGYGKRISGWVLATHAEGRFALYKVDLMRKNAEGRTRKLKEFAGSAVKALAKNGENARAAQIAKVAGLPKRGLGHG